MLQHPPGPVAYWLGNSCPTIPGDSWAAVSTCPGASCSDASTVPETCRSGRLSPHPKNGATPRNRTADTVIFRPPDDVQRDSAIRATPPPGDDLDECAGDG